MIAAANFASAAAELRVQIGEWHSSQVVAGAVPNARPYDVRITGKPGDAVHLSALGLPRGWVASFCTPTVCAPFRVSIRLPESGQFESELQIIPPDGQRGKRLRFSVTALDATSRATGGYSSGPGDVVRTGNLGRR